MATKFKILSSIEEVSADAGGFSSAETKKKRKIKTGPLRALILTPTRELAIQVRNHIQAICKYTNIKIVAIGTYVKTIP